MTIPPRPDAALAYLERLTGIDHGPLAGHLIRALGYIDAIEYENARLRREAETVRQARADLVALLARIRREIDLEPGDDLEALAEANRS